MKRRKLGLPWVWVRLTFVAAVAILLTVGIVVAINRPVPGSTVAYTADFSDANGLRPVTTSGCSASPSAR